VTGQVSIYTCPVVTPGADCYDPYPTGITVTTGNGRFVTKLMTDSQGHFEVFLKPGKYVLIPDGARDGALPSVDELAVQVEKKQFTPVTIIYDSGIR
jgi:hypothetical protein